MNEIKIEIRNLNAIMKKIKALEGAGEKAVSYTVKDIKARAPSWVAKEVTATYNIDKKEIIPGSTRKVKGGGTKAVKQAGSLRVKGDTLETMTLVYEGRRLTPVHFGMTPKSPPKGKSYTLKAQILKGSKKVIGRYENTRTKGGPYSQRSHNILMGTGNTKEDGVNWIPFQRKSKKRTDLGKFLTTSVPQMVDNPEVHTRIYNRLSEETEKRLRNNMKRFMKV